MNSMSKNIIKGMILTSFLTIGCAKKVDGTHQIAVQFGSYTTAKHKILRLLLPEANAAVSTLKMCFKRLRFKTADDPSVTADPAVDNDNVDFNLGLVDISSGSTALGVITLPAGNYTRLEFDLENSCVGGNSITLVNGNGSYASTDRITIKFEGNFSANADGTLTLGVQQILTALNSYNGAGTLKTAAESISGALSN